MHATPDEVLPLHAPFEVVMRGFNRQQVLDHLESLEGRIEMITADRDAALQQVADLSKLLDHLRREVQQATGHVERLQRSSLGGAGLRIQRMLQVAEDEVTALQASTEQEVTSLRERTRAESERLLRETSQHCERLEAESERRRKAAEAESALRCRQTEQESARRLRLAEQQTEHDIARRESEAGDRIRDYQIRGMTGLHFLTRVVGERLDSRLSEIELEITRLRQLRAEVTTRLMQAHGVLSEAVDQVRWNSEIEQDEKPELPVGATLSGAGSAGHVVPATTLRPATAPDTPWAGTG